MQQSMTNGTTLWWIAYPRHLVLAAESPLPWIHRILAPCWVTTDATSRTQKIPTSGAHCPSVTAETISAPPVRATATSGVERSFSPIRGFRRRLRSGYASRRVRRVGSRTCLGGSGVLRRTDLPLIASPIVDFARQLARGHLTKRDPLHVLACPRLRSRRCNSPVGRILSWRHGLPYGTLPPRRRSGCLARSLGTSQGAEEATHVSFPQTSLTPRPIRG
jgi:hypothetical protein